VQIIIFYYPISVTLVYADDNSRVMLTGASNDYINASHLKVISQCWRQCLIAVRGLEFYVAASSASCSEVLLQVNPSSVSQYLGTRLNNSSASVTCQTHLRSSSSSQLAVRPSCRLTVGDRLFATAGPRNSLPEDITTAPSLTIFRRRLKTHTYFGSHIRTLFCSFIFVFLAMELCT